MNDLDVVIYLLEQAKSAKAAYELYEEERKAVTDSESYNAFCCRWYGKIPTKQAVNGSIQMVRRILLNWLYERSFDA